MSQNLFYFRAELKYSILESFVVIIEFSICLVNGVKFSLILILDISTLVTMTKTESLQIAWSYYEVNGTYLL